MGNTTILAKASLGSSQNRYPTAPSNTKGSLTKSPSTTETARSIIIESLIVREMSSPVLLLEK